MKNKIIAMLVCILLLIGIVPISAAEEGSDDIIILYENDVHCVVEGYSKLSAMKKELQQTYNYVGVVSCGDYIQGNSLGIISKGEYIVNLMNLVGYDAVTLGNHEFDYHMDRLGELIGMMNTKPICCNFQKIGEDAPYFDPYTIVSYGDVDIAYIGITTPSTISSSSPVQFKDENGDYIYTFHPTDLYDIVQTNIDSAKAEGADYVIALSHIGYADDEIYGGLEDVEDLIRNTDGFDVVLDAHSHTVIEEKTIADEGGNDVLLTSTGTQFEYIGKLTISNGELTTELIKTADYQLTDPAADAHIQHIYDEFSVLGNRKVATSEVDLIIADADENRLVRRHETNLGDLCADAFRSVTGADIGYINGGNLRAGISAGDITYNQMLDVLPFNNTVVLAEISGQTLKDMMEMAMKTWPEENGAFPHISGIRFSVNTAIPSSVVLNGEEEFIGVSGEYRVYDIEIFNKETEKYEPVNLTQTYTIAATNYYLLEYGSGMKMLENVEILQNDGLLDVEVLERYITEELDGVVGQKYAEADVNITFTEGEINTTKDETGDTEDAGEATEEIESTTDVTDDGLDSAANVDITLLIVCIIVGLGLVSAVIFLIVKRIHFLKKSD
jgi:2',3'-cyclic-nucleotide 2'-phosphodiesterase (5'-nucleotidase family)